MASTDENVKHLVGIAVNILAKTSESNTTDKNMKDLLGIAVNILAKTSESNITDKNMKDLLGIAVNILAKQVKPSTSFVLPQASLRIKDVVISVQQSDNQNDVLSIITPEYDGTKIKIIKNNVNDVKSSNQTGSNEIIKTLGLVDINLADLKEPSKKQGIIQEVVKKLRTEYKIDEEEYKQIEDYFNKIGAAIDSLKTNTDILKKNTDTLKTNTDILKTNSTIT